MIKLQIPTEDSEKNQYQRPKLEIQQKIKKF